ncbi:MAG: hypothetical protein ACREEM_09610 [Blastocatellia bacterium]
MRVHKTTNAIEQRTDSTLPPATVSRRNFLQVAVGGAVGAPLLAALLNETAAAAPFTTTLLTVGDTFIRRDLPNRNEGANTLLRVGAGPLMRTLVEFNATELAAAIRRPGFNFLSAHLVLDVAANRGPWSDAATIDAYPLLRSFAEGNGGAVNLLAPSKLVGIALHDNPKYCGPGAPYLANIPSVDFYGVNTYQTVNLDPVFRAVPGVGKGYTGLTGTALKPVIITEFGMPATGHRTSDRSTIYEDATTRQRAANVVGHMAPLAYDEKLCLGLYYFEYCDEWWKTDGSIFKWLGGAPDGGRPNCYGDESGFGLYSVALGAGLPANSPPYVGGPTSAGPRLPIDVQTERTEITTALKKAFAGERPFPGIPPLCGR